MCTPTRTLLLWHVQHRVAGGHVRSRTPGRVLARDLPLLDPRPTTLDANGNIAPQPLSTAARPRPDTSACTGSLDTPLLSPDNLEVGTAHRPRAESCATLDDNEDFHDFPLGQSVRDARLAGCNGSDRT